MKSRRLTASVAAAIVAAASLLAAGGTPASAATSPSRIDFIPLDGGCVIEFVLTEFRDASGAYEEVGIINTPCARGVEAGIKAPDGTPSSWGNDVHSNGETSTTGHIPINSGNHHGLRGWTGSQWKYMWLD
jgi:hypothetical protein